MKILKYTNYIDDEKSYEILINQEDNLNAEEISKCFKKQYPDTFCVIKFSEIIQMKIGLIIIGLPEVDE